MPKHDPPGDDAALLELERELMGLDRAIRVAAAMAPAAINPIATEDDDYRSHTSPGSNLRKRSVEMLASFKASASAMSGASIGSSVSWNVP
jgi:hypothetical protein